MGEATLEEFLADNQDAIVVAAQERMRGEDTMVRLAAQRELSESDLLHQVLGFWLQAIRTDVTLGSTAAMEQNLGWLVRLRAGHDLPFEDVMVQRMFDDICTEVDARLGSEAMREEYATYRGKVEVLIAEAFPQSGEARP